MGLPSGMLDEQAAAIAESMAENGEDRLPVSNRASKVDDTIVEMKFQHSSTVAPMVHGT